ncbi:galactosyltransferase-related protein [Lacinutrix neustonica]|uniref:Galactosyltransferase-related protein n=1 Tax=Lacinutrix neustonica TaxID=2980107 RepID=A0A9E8MUS1_9FLAO|nr:galactosyltransferase-related protein [Lacinutrix neustonica]WAC01942.1 galactosyltransferase-related protein [Lacinutrix neustonica]
MKAPIVLLAMSICCIIQEFITVLEQVAKERVATYFQVGFLSETESKKTKPFGAYKVAFKSNNQATGMTVYNTELLKSIGGYDEFYNGWGSEDTDVHVRLKNAGHTVRFYSDALLILHQWHAKHYRMNNDNSPLHSRLEQINAAYLDLVASTNRMKANTDQEWGVYHAEDYKQLQHSDETYNITNRGGTITAFINGVLLPATNKVIHLQVNVHKDYKSFKQTIKKRLGKKTMAFDSMQEINDQLLECIIRNLRNQPYKYQYNRNDETITLIIKL